MLIQQVIFAGFAIIAVGSALMVVSTRNPVRAVLFLVLAFIASAGIWMLAYAEFLALILVLVYVGAVMTLFLFVVMMLNIDVATGTRRFVRYLPLGFAIVGLLVFLMILAIKPEHFGLIAAADSARLAPNYSNVTELGRVLYTTYAYPLEIAASLLLVAIIAAISLTHLPPRHARTQKPVEQIRVRREDRVRLVKMKTENPEEPVA